MKTKTEKLNAKKQKLKDKMAAKKKKVGRAAKAVAVLALVLAAAGCFTDPKSRANQSELGDQKATVEVRIAENSHSNVVSVVQHITAGDVGYQAADSAGSTETQSATPTWTFPIKVDARYNDVLSKATDATKATLSTIGGGLGAVLDMMVSGKSGKVDVTKTDGTAATVKCENGQCSYCEECEIK